MPRLRRSLSTFVFNKPSVTITKELLFGSSKRILDTLPPPIPASAPSSATEKAVVDKPDIVAPIKPTSLPLSPLETVDSVPQKTTKKRKIVKKNNESVETQSIPDPVLPTPPPSPLGSKLPVEWTYDGMNIPWIQ